MSPRTPKSSSATQPARSRYCIRRDPSHFDQALRRAETRQHIERGAVERSKRAGSGQLRLGLEYGDWYARVGEALRQRPDGAGAGD
jgi:hypothetical protein